MGFTHAFKVSTKDSPTVEVSRELPENLDDPLWDSITISKDGIHELALQAWIVKAQAGARNRLEAGEGAVRQYISGYQYGARGGGYSAPIVSTDDAKAQKFSPAQLKFLAAAGMNVEE